MTKLTKSAHKDFAIKLFECLGYDYIHAPDGDVTKAIVRKFE